MRRNTAIFCFAAALAAPLSAFAAAASAELAPDFALKSLSGTNQRLSEHRGEVVLVNFWATWCGPCRQEMPLLNQIYQRYHAVGFEMLGVNIDDTSGRATDMARTLGVSFPVLFDDTKAVSRQYKVNTMPTTLLIGRDGTVRYRHEGYQPGYEQQYIDQIRTLLKE